MSLVIILPISVFNVARSVLLNLEQVDITMRVIKADGHLSLVVPQKAVSPSQGFVVGALGVARMESPEICGLSSWPVDRNYL